MSERVTTILLVDDNPQLRRPLKIYLQKRGYRVIEAGDGLEAVAAAVEHRPDAILLDVMMPVVDGFEALKRLKKNNATRNIPVMMLTAVNDKERIVGGLTNGAADYVIKGAAGVADISRRMERLIEKSRNRSDITQAHSGEDAEQRVVSDFKLRQAIEELAGPGAMPARIAEALPLVGNTDSTLQDWADFLGKNKSLAETMATLAAVNSPQGARKDRPPDEFLVAFGTHRLRYLALAAAILSSFAEFPGRGIHLHLLRTGVLAGSIALEVLDGGSDEALAAGLLHDFGKMLFRNRFPSQYSTVVKRAGEEKKPVACLEKGMLGMNHADFAGEILRAWGFPGELVDAVRLHHSAWRDITEHASFNPFLAAVVQLADALDRTWNLVTDEDDLILPHSEETARALGIKEQSLRALLDRAAARMQRAESLMPDDAAAQPDLPEWVNGLAWKKILLVQGKEDEMLLLGTFLNRCEAVVERALYKEAPEKIEGCEGVFLSISGKAEAEQAAGIAEKIAASENPLPVCAFLNGPIDPGERFNTMTVMRPPLSLTEIASLIRETAISLPVGEENNG